MTALRVGIVGAGTMGKAHAVGWSATGAEVVGVAARSQDAAAPLALSLGVEAFESYDELLATVDVVDLCVPTDLHCAMTVRAAAAARHVVCEKPIALSVEDGQAMIDACEAAGVRLFVAMVVRFFPQYRAAREAVAAGQLGALGVMRFKRVAYQPIGDAGWFIDEARSGGMILDLMIHDFDYARWLGGEVERVFARSLRSRDPEAPADYALATLRFCGGAMAQVEGGWSYPPGVFRTAFDIAGSGGLIEWDSDSSESIHRRLMPTEPKGVDRVGVPLTVAAEDPYTTEIRHVYDALIHDRPFDVSAEDALAALRIALAVRKSAREGRAVTLEEV